MSFFENRGREGCAFVMGVSELTLTRTLKPYDTLNVKNALVKCVYYATAYDIFNFVVRVCSELPLFVMELS